jgi:hypothetical protein
VNIYSFWRLITVVLLAALALPAGAALAQERGASLVVEGLTTVVVNGERYPASQQRDTVVLIGSDFAANELVGLWVTLPDGSVIGLDDNDLRADEGGVFGIELGLGAGLPTGRHFFLVRGKRSGRGVLSVARTRPRPKRWHAAGLQPGNRQAARNGRSDSRWLRAQ